MKRLTKRQRDELLREFDERRVALESLGQKWELKRLMECRAWADEALRKAAKLLEQPK